MSKTKLVAERNSHELHTTREFNAPRNLVFRAFTDPRLIPQWWGPRGYETSVDQMDVRKGGIWRYVQRSTNGDEHIFNGVYHEITASERIVFTMEYEGNPSHIMLETLTFENRDGKTFVTDSLVFQSIADRDDAIQSGMEAGAVDTWDRFEELLRKM